MADKSWYYTKPGKPAAGPVFTADLRRMAADGRLDRADLLSRTPDGRRVRADAVAGLFTAGEAVADTGNPFALPAAGAARVRRPVPDADEADEDAPPARRPPGMLDLGFRRFVTPTLVSVLWGAWVFAAVPLLTLLIAAQPVVVLVGGARGLAPDDDAREAVDDPAGWVGRPVNRPAAKPAGPSAQAVALAIVLAVVELVALAACTLLVRVGLESVVVLFRGAEAVMAIDVRQRAGDG